MSEIIPIPTRPSILQDLETEIAGLDDGRKIAFLKDVIYKQAQTIERQRTMVRNAEQYAGEARAEFSKVESLQAEIAHLELKLRNERQEHREKIRDLQRENEAQTYRLRETKTSLEDAEREATVAKERLAAKDKFMNADPYAFFRGLRAAGYLVIVPCPTCKKAVYSARAHHDGTLGMIDPTGERHVHAPKTRR